MADTGYFDSVSANLKTGVGAQVKGISEGVKANSEAGVSPSVNALDTGVKAAAAIGGLADGLSEAAMLPVLGAMGILPPATSALLHNASTLAISLKSMTNLLPENKAPQLKA